MMQRIYKISSCHEQRRQNQIKLVMSQENIYYMLSPFCNIFQYADDLALYTSDINAETASPQLNSALAYLHDHDFSLSVEKSNIVIFYLANITPNITNNQL